MVTRTALVALTLATVVVPLGVAAPAHASHGGGDAIRSSGRCASGAHWALKAKPDDGRIEVEGEVDSNRTGQVWRWTMRHNASLSASGAARTSGASGSFSVQRRMADLGGPDRFVFRAVHAGQVCRGAITF